MGRHGGRVGPTQALGLQVQALDDRWRRGERGEGTEPVVHIVGCTPRSLRTAPPDSLCASRTSTLQPASAGRFAATRPSGTCSDDHRVQHARLLTPARRPGCLKPEVGRRQRAEFHPGTWSTVRPHLRPPPPATSSTHACEGLRPAYNSMSSLLRMSAFILRCIIRRAASARSAWMCATASSGTVTCRCRM